MRLFYILLISLGIGWPGTLLTSQEIPEQWFVLTNQEAAKHWVALTNQDAAKLWVALTRQDVAGHLVAYRLSGGRPAGNPDNHDKGTPHGIESGKERDYSIPDFENAPYGPYERNVLDFWKAKSEDPTPLVVFYHGGGFRQGSKQQARRRYANEIEVFLNHGISFAAINYRFRSRDTSRLHEGTRLDTILLDCARAIQFLRYHSKQYNIDKDRIGAFGGSAGGGASLWLGTTDDLADPDNPDPVLRESSRIQAVGHLNSQATYDWARWAEILNMPQEMVWDHIRTDDIELMQLKRDEMFDKRNEEVKRLRNTLDMLGHITPDDPPILTDNRKENIVPGNVIHHPRHSLAVKAKCNAVGVKCAINLVDTPPEKQTGIVEFMLKHLQ